MTTTTSLPLSFTCPSWCTEPAGHTAHDDEKRVRVTSIEVGDKLVPTVSSDHTGPSFGPFRASGEVVHATGREYVDVIPNDEWVQENLVSREITDPAMLRQLAADALAAADWLEAHKG